MQGPWLNLLYKVEDAMNLPKFICSNLKKLMTLYPT
jgi:hypothetical protein